MMVPVLDTMTLTDSGQAFAQPSAARTAGRPRGKAAAAEDALDRRARARRSAERWVKLFDTARALGDGAGDAILLVLALAPTAASAALALAAFGVIKM